MGQPKVQESSMGWGRIGRFGREATKNFAGSQRGNGGMGSWRF